jgi:tetratricopeptide (TPR) repeat protein
VSSLALERLVQSRATPHRTGNRAELMSLRARLRDARKIGDTESEKNLSAQLARKLVSRGTRLREATKLARRSLLLSEDPELREELSNWFAGLGEVALAAGTLEPLTDRAGDNVARAATWTRIAVLRGRAGDAVGAARALWNAAEADNTDPVALELFAALRIHTGASMSSTRAARALLEAARRRKAKNDDRGAHSDLLQAFECDPGYLPATEQLADSLFQAGRFAAADEVWRLAAERHPDPAPVHSKRLRDALGSSDVALALGAALDDGADTTLDLDGIRTAVTLVNDGAGTVPVPNFDGLLGPAGLLTWLAARLEVAALQRADQKALVALSRLVAGPLGNPRQAAQHLIDALMLAPDSDEVVHALKDYAVSTGDHAAMVDACLRIVSRDDVPEGVLRDRLTDLALTSAQYGSEPHCALWALSRLSALGPLSPELSELESRLARRDSALPNFDEWTRLSLAELRRAVDALGERPQETEAYVAALLEMRRRDPSATRFRLALERAFLRMGALDRLESFWRDELASGRDRSAARVGLCRLYVQGQRPEEALSLLREASVESLGADEAALLGVVASMYGTKEDRALGLQKLADHARAPVRAVLLSVASSVLLGAGRVDRAVRVAEDACHSAPSAARPVVAYAQASVGQRTRVASLSFQRASEIVVPRVEWCRALAEARDDPKTVELALRRWLSLAPLDLDASRQLLAHLCEREDAEQLAKTLDWLIGQPVALGALFDELASALRVVLRFNPLGAKALCQRMLGVFGARDERVSALIDEVAQQIAEPWLRVALLERRQATSAQEGPREYLELASVREELAHADLAYDALGLALEAGAEPLDIRVQLGRLGEPESSDGTLAQLGCWARVQETNEPEDAAQAYRDYGAALWDLAGDAELAVEAWHRAAEIDEDHGDERLARDVIAFCGYETGLPRLFDLASRRAPLHAASLLIAAAALALSDGFKPEAAKLADKGLELAPGRTDALAIIERALPLEAVEVLAHAYAVAQASLLGIYGERALHYRAARQFERRRHHELAFRHAVQAFEAVPAEGVAFALMLRLAPLVSQEAEAARAIERVAQAQTDPARRATWLEHAARAAGQGPEGTRLRVDVLMRALLVRPEVESLEALGVALVELFQALPDERPKLQAQFDSSTRTLLRRLDDAELVAVAVTAARVAANVFASAGLTAGALRRALQLDPDSAAFEGVTALVSVLATKPGSTRPFLDELAEACSKQPLPRRALLELGIALAEKNATDLLPTFVVAVAKKDPDDPVAIERARALSLEHPHLAAELRGIVDAGDRVSAVLERSEQLAHSDPELAERLLEELLETGNLPDEGYERVIEQLERLYVGSGRAEQLEKLLTLVIESSRLALPVRVGAARRLARTLSERSASAQALDLFALIDRLGSTTGEDLVQAAELARDAGDPGREHELRARLLAQCADDAARLEQLGRLIQLGTELGQTPKAIEWAEQALRIDSAHEGANDLLIKEAERREDFTRYVDLLRGRLRRAHEPSEKDLFALVDVLRNRQKRPRAAAELLAQYSGRGPNSARLEERLAECWLDASDVVAAADAYARACRATREPDAVARLTELAVQNYLLAGELEQASRLLQSDSIHPKTPGLAQLRVEVAEKQGDHTAHGLALEELAATSMAPPAERAEYLRRAAEVALELGDADLALKRAQRAARIAPAEPKVQVFARLLEYKQRGAGTTQQALSTITELRSLGRLDDERLVGLRAFLLAEALATRMGPVAAVKELREAERAWPDHPLIALGLAEHLGQSAGKEEVLAYYQKALHESISVVRSPVEVALAAARYAESHGASGSAIEVLEPYASRSSEVAEMLSRLQTLPSAKTRFDLPHAPDAQARAPEFFASVPPGSAPKASPLEGVVPTGTAPVRTGSTSTGPASSPLVAALRGGLEQARAPVRSLGRKTSPSGSSPVAGSSSDGPSVPRPRPPASATAKTHPEMSAVRPQRGQPKPPSPASPIDASRRSGDAEAPGSPPLAGSVSPLAPTAKPPAKPLTQTSGEYRAVKSPKRDQRLDRTIEIPSMEVPKERPVQVHVKPDSRTLGETWNSIDAGELSALARAEAVRLGDALTSRPPAKPPAQTSQSVQVGQFAAQPPPVSRASLSFPAASASEQALLQALRAGNVQAGRDLVLALESQPARSHDLVNVCRAVVQLSPGQLEPVDRLIDAALRDRDGSYAAALRHCVFTFRNPASAPVAPPLQHQTEQTEVLVRLLCGAPLSPALEALSILCRTVPQLFRQHESLEGTRRVAVDGLSPLAQLVSSLQRLLGTHKTVVLERPAPRPITFRLLLGDPVTVLIDGEGNPLLSEYRHYFGATLFGSRPELALACGLPRERLAVVFDAVLAAFGPPRQLQGEVARIAQLAERLWESVPARAQRRLQELCEQPDQVTLERALRMAQSAWVRAGLFASGDLGIAARDASRLVGIDSAALYDSQVLKSACEQHEILAELFRFATSLEFAALRWNEPRTLSSVHGQL